jgi:hypothetical protein
MRPKTRTTPQLSLGSAEILRRRERERLDEGLGMKRENGREES